MPTLKDINKAFLYVREERSVELAALLDRGLSANTRNSYGELRLIDNAVLFGSIECLKVLLERKVDFITVVHGWEPPVMVAANEGHFDCVSLLVKYGANYSLRDSDGKTLLMKAAKAGALECMKQLIAAGADIHEKFATGNENGVLHEALYGGHPEAVCLLLEAGVRIPNEKMKDARYLLMVSAMSSNNCECVNILLQHGFSPANRNERGRGLLAEAMMCSTEMIRFLLQNGADIDNLDEAGRSLEEIASITGRMDVAVEAERLRLAHAIDCSDSTHADIESSLAL